VKGAGEHVSGRLMVNVAAIEKADDDSGVEVDQSLASRGPTPTTPCSRTWTGCAAMVTG
jgi:hypothetical protein